VVKMLWTGEAQPSESTINFDHCNGTFLLLIRVQNMLNHIQIFFATISKITKEIFVKICGQLKTQTCTHQTFLSKGIVQHIDASNMVWTLIDNDKLANQIVRLVAILLW